MMEKYNSLFKNLLVFLMGLIIIGSFSCQQEDVLDSNTMITSSTQVKSGESVIQNVTIEKAGTLVTLITDVGTIEELVIKGPINGTDINCIRGMSKLKTLNLENADIVAGGENYAAYAWSSEDAISTVNNVITRNMFESQPFTTIVIPKSVSRIDQGGFIYSKISSIIIPENIEGIGDHAFLGCSNLVNVKILSPLKEIPGNAFSSCGNLINVDLPETLSTIGGSAFASCKKLKSIIIPPNVTTIGSSAFFDAGLRTVVIPNSVISIGNNAFNDTQLTHIEIPASVVNVGDQAFESVMMEYVYWHSPSDITVGMFDYRMSTNCLVYITKDVGTPSNWNNIIYNGVAEKIVLSDDDNKPFYCPKAFKTKRVTYVHNFNQITGQGEAAGWETILLPFTVQKIVHEDGRILSPFNRAVDSAKYFWLRTLTMKGFKDKIILEANTPYIIAMPNNMEYEEQYRINGKVTFEAANELEGINIVATPDEMKTNGTYFSLSGTYGVITASNSVYPINKNDNSNGLKPGSLFVRSLRNVNPFEAYVMSNSISSGGLSEVYKISDVMKTKVLDNVINNRQKRKPLISDL